MERLGHRPLPVALPGVDDGSTTATLGEQVEAVLAVVDQAERPLVVGHSAGATLAWIVADRRPDGISGVVLIGGFPAGDGDVYADFFPVTDGVMVFPGWEPFEGPDAGDLSREDRDRIAARAVAVPEGVARGIVGLTNPGRFDVPVLLVCPEFSPDEARAWIAGGDLPELARANHVEYADIDSGHWPMVTRPVELARLLESAAKASAPT